MQIKPFLIGLAIGLAVLGIIWWATPSPTPDLKLLLDNQKRQDQIASDSILAVTINAHDDSLSQIIQGLEGRQQLMRDSIAIIKKQYALKKVAVHALNADGTINLLRTNLISR